MPPIIISVELLGDPPTDVHERLHQLMHNSLNWETEMSAANGVVISLPRATYAGQTELPLIDLADDLKAQIASQVWPGGAKVLVVRWLEWAQSSTS